MSGNRNGIYIQMFSPHGLIRSQNPEIGRDKDTGGQVKYVLELIEQLSRHESVRKIDLFTRKINDKRVSPAYAEGIEVVNEKARIIRVTCGGNTYRQKEQLWEHLDEFIDKTIRFIEQEDDYPDVVHGHYADGIYLAGEISSVFGIPFLATAHSLGRNKQQLLLNEGWSEEKINERFNMNRRIAVEEDMMQHAAAVVVSTRHEIDNHYSLYEHKDEPEFEIIPPGTNTEMFYPFYRQQMPSHQMTIEEEQALYRVNSDIERFLFQPEKPLILSIGRADRRKNFETIIQAFGDDKELQAMANLAIYAGVRKDISLMPADEQDILTNLLLLMDKYDLYGKMAIPKKNDPKLDVPEIYRVAARKKGVFVNATPGENFGLTIVESAACGLPVIASPTGGPKEILEHTDCGILVNTDDPKNIADAVKKIISDKAKWDQYSSNGIKGVNKLYSWSAHANKYMSLVTRVLEAQKTTDADPHLHAYGKKLAAAKLFVICDLDGTLVDGSNTDGLSELKEWIATRDGQVVFGVASGRNKEITEEAFTQYDLPEPDILICSAGSEIYYTTQLISDKGWESHINYQWKRAALLEALSSFPGIRPQEKAAQWPFKLSYYVSESFNDDNLADLHKFLDDHKLRARVLLTDNKYLDFLPFRASKGSAVRYLGYKWKLPLSSIITAGNSGNDADMLQGKARGIVVSNYSPELEALRKKKGVFFTAYPLARGVLDGIEHYTADMDLQANDR